MFKNLKWVRLIPDAPGKGGWKTGFHSWQAQPLNEVRTTQYCHVYRGRWRKDFDSQAVPSTINHVNANIVALALHVYTYPNLTDASAQAPAHILGHHAASGTNFYWDFTSGSVRDSHNGNSVNATFLNIAGRCFVGDGAIQGVILDNRDPAIHPQLEQWLGIDSPTMPLGVTAPPAGFLMNAAQTNLSPFAAAYANSGSPFVNSPDPECGIGTVPAGSGFVANPGPIQVGDVVTVTYLNPGSFNNLIGAMPGGAVTVAGVSSKAGAFATPGGTLSCSNGSSKVTLSVPWGGAFGAFHGLAINFNGFSFVIAGVGPGGVYDTEGTLNVLGANDAQLLGVYSGPSVAGVPYTITGCTLKLTTVATTIGYSNSASAGVWPANTLGYGQSTASLIVPVKVQATVGGATRHLGKMNMGASAGAAAHPGPRYAYAWYDPETGHMSNISPITEIQVASTATAASDGTTPFFEIDYGKLSYPERTSVHPDARRFSHIVFFRTLSTPGASTLYPIGSLQPYSGKVHPGFASTRGIWNTTPAPNGVGWLGLPNADTDTLPASNPPPTYWFDFSSDADLLLSGGFRAPQFTNSKPIASIRGGETEAGKVAYQAYWDRRLWVSTTQEPDVIAFSCDEAQCPLGLPEESFPATNRLRIPAVDGQVCGMRMIGEMLLITTLRWAYTVVGNNESNYRLLRVSARMNGVPSWNMDEFPSDLEGTPAIVYFLGSDKIVYQWVPGGSCTAISAPIQDALNTQLSSRSAYVFGSRVHCISSWGRRLVVVSANWAYFPFIWDVDNQVWTKNSVDDGTSGFQPGCQGFATIYGQDPPVNEIFSNPISGGGAITVRSWIRDDGTNSGMALMVVEFWPTTFDGVKKRKQLCVVNAHVSGGVWQTTILINEAGGPPFGENVQMIPQPDPLNSYYGTLPAPVDSGTAEDLIAPAATVSANPSAPMIGYRFGIAVGRGIGTGELYAVDIGYVDVEEPGEVDA